MAWKIEPAKYTEGWWLFEGTEGAWWHVYRDTWFAVYPTLDAVFERIKERT